MFWVLTLKQKEFESLNYSKKYLPVKIISVTYSTQGLQLIFNRYVAQLLINYFLYLYKTCNLTWFGFLIYWMLECENAVSKSAIREVDTGFAISVNSNRVRSRTCLIISSLFFFFFKWKNEHFSVTNVRK